MPADPRRVKEVFAAALDLTDPPARQALVERECADDAELRQRVEVLLHAHDNPLPALDRPLAEVMPREPAATAEELPGTILVGRYKLIERIGEGGMGSVWIAQQTEPVKRTVAVKLIKNGVDSKTVLARFDVERQALALMDHPNIARVLDAGTTERGSPFFVMELVKGVPITTFCDARKLTARQRLELFIPVCQAIQHAHQKGIIHRDIKPSNVLVAMYDDRPVPKVIDFGIAKATGAQLTERTLLTGFAIVGTPQYMSPEQATLNNLDIDTRSDIYSLGVLLYELLAGSPPFRRKDLEKAGMLEILRVIREEEPSKPSTKVSTADALPSLAANRSTEPAKLTRLLRGEIDWIVMKALDKERSRRYETANGFAMDIQRYLADEPVLAGPPSTAYRLKKFVKRNKGQVIAVGLVLLALLAGMAGTTVGLLRAEQARQREADRAEGERLAKLDAETAAEAERLAKLEAQKSAKAEKKAKEQAQKRLKQIEKGIVILTSMFHDLDPKSEEKEGESLRVLLGKRLAEAVEQLEGEAVGDPVVVARLQVSLGRALQELGHYDLAEVVLTKARRTQEEAQGAEHLDTLTAKNCLAELYDLQGKHKPAESLFKSVLAGRTAKLGDENHDTLTTKLGLASVYASQGKYELAKTLVKNVLEVRTAKLGANHPGTLVAKNNLAEVYRSQGQYLQAETLYKEVLKAKTTNRGAKHPDTLTTKNNLALMYNLQGKYELAERLFKEVVEVETAKLGTEHPRTLLSMNNLAALYQDQGKYPQAEKLHKEVLEIGVPKLGPDHPLILTTNANLASLYKRQRKYAQAEALLKKVQDAFTAKFGPDHPGTLKAKNNLAGVYLQQGKYQQAETLYKEVLKTNAANSAAEHPLTLITKQNLALLYKLQGKYGQAERLFKEVLEARINKTGAEHPDTLMTKNNLASVFRSQAKYASAETMFKEVLKIRTANLGAEHPDTLTTKNDLGLLFGDQRKYKPAETLFKEVIEVRTARWGANSPDTLLTKNNLAALYWKMKKLDLSIPLFEELVKQRKKQGEDDLNTLVTLTNLGVNYRDAGRLDDGIRCFEEAMTTVRKVPNPLPPQLAWIRREAAATYDRAKQYAKSEPLYRESLEQARKQFGGDDPRTADLMAQLARTLLAQKKHTDAEKTLRDCLAIREKKRPEEWSTFNTKSMLGEVLASQKKYADADPLLKDGYAGLKKRQDKIPEPVRAVRLTEALTRLVQMYEATGNKGEAANWRKKLAALKADASR